MPRLTLAPPIGAFLDLIALSENTANSPVTKDDGYDMLVAGIYGPSRFTDYSTHPFHHGRPPIIVRDAQPALYGEPDPLQPGVPRLIRGPIPKRISTAAGRYHITLPTWYHLEAVRTLGTFSPHNQDTGALQLLIECHAYEAIERGDIQVAIEAAAFTWFSLPASLKAAGPRTLTWLLSTYDECVRAIQAKEA
jgi:muramidase (phage lysozyme)